MKKFSEIFCLVLVALMLFATPISAAAPYQTYTYSINGTALHSPDAYLPSKDIDSAYMGLLDVDKVAPFYPGLDEAALAKKAVALNKPSDIETDDKGNVYIADTDNNRIVVLDRYYKLKFILSNFENNNGVPDAFKGPSGVFITSDKIVEGKTVEGKIYVCDTKNSRIVVFSRDGEFLSIIEAPQSEMFESGSVYSPVALAVDNYDRLYVVSSSTYQGIIVMTDKGEFTQFVGAQKVTATFWETLWKKFQTDEQKEQQEEKLSSEYNNITVNDKGHIYVTTSSIDEEQVRNAISSKSKSGDYAPVKLLNAAGDEIMKRTGFYPPSGEIDISRVMASDRMVGVSTVVDVAIGPEGTWSIIDQKRSKVFTYDTAGNLLFAFGDVGAQIGNISQKGLAGITYQGTNMLLLDKTTGRFAVYELTEYGKVIVGAIANTNNRQYDKAIDDWTEILKRNSNFDTAYIGIGNALYRSGQYEEAMSYYQSAYDTSNYSNAFKEVRKEWISKYIIVIPIVIIAVCLIWSKFMKFAGKVNKRVATSGERRTYGNQLLFAFHIIFHPFDGYWDMKHEKRGSLKAGFTILAVTVVAFYYNNIGKGYLLNPQGGYSTIFATALSVIVPLALFIAGNWCITTLFDGEGSVKDITMAACYALTPFTILVIPVTAMTNFVLLEEADLLNLLITFAFIWMAILLILGVMVVHDYSMGKNLVTILATILAMVCIMFIILLFSTLLGKLVGFVANIVEELQYRA